MSIHCFRAQIFQVWGKLYMDNGAHLSSYSFIAQIDAEVTEVTNRFPWYLKDDPETLRQRLSPGFANMILWMRHILESSIYTQRVRLYRPFLNPLVGDSWRRCVTASTSVLAVYKALRATDVARFQRSQKMHVQAYQAFAAAVALATFLLVEMPSNANTIRTDIELVAEDLMCLNRDVDDNRRIPLISEGSRIIKRILRLCDARYKNSNHSCTASNEGSGDAGAREHNEAPTALVPVISHILGGESSAQRYLERCSIDYMVNGASTAEDGTGSGGMYDVEFELAAWDALLDPSQSEQWNDAFWADLDARIGLGPDGS